MPGRLPGYPHTAFVQSVARMRPRPTRARQHGRRPRLGQRRTRRCVPPHVGLYRSAFLPWDRLWVLGESAGRVVVQSAPMAPSTYGCAHPLVIDLSPSIGTWPTPPPKPGLPTRSGITATEPPVDRRSRRAQSSTCGQGQPGVPTWTVGRPYPANPWLGWINQGTRIARPRTRPASRSWRASTAASSG
jgi:hypothetical protein